MIWPWFCSYQSIVIAYTNETSAYSPESRIDFSKILFKRTPKEKYKLHTNLQNNKSCFEHNTHDVLSVVLYKPLVNLAKQMAQHTDVLFEKYLLAYSCCDLVHLSNNYKKYREQLSKTLFGLKSMLDGHLGRKGERSAPSN